MVHLTFSAILVLWRSPSCKYSVPSEAVSYHGVVLFGYNEFPGNLFELQMESRLS